MDGNDLDKAFKVHGIQLADEEIDEVLSILSNHGNSTIRCAAVFPTYPISFSDESIDIYEFCYLVNAATMYVAQLKSKTFLATTLVVII